VVLNASGSIIQNNHYYPFGATFYDSSGATAQPYQYNGKEMETKNGLNWLDYGARMMDPSLGRFGTMDRFAEKYYSLSPYQYAANNPMNNIDVNGDSLFVSDGDGAQMLYTAGMKYTGDNAFFAASVSNLNSNDGGQDDDPKKKTTKANMAPAIPVVGGIGATISSAAAGVLNILMAIPILLQGDTDPYSPNAYVNKEKAGTTNEEIEQGTSTSSIDEFAHEKTNKGGKSIGNEVEAGVFSSIIANNLRFASTNGALGSSNGLGNGTVMGKAYESAFTSLTKSFTKPAFIKAIQNFKKGSMENASGMYNNYPLLSKEQNLLLKSYYPK
jgi:RHS repeat-associated protein